MEHKITCAVFYLLEAKMLEEEKSRATIEKYKRDVKKFIAFVGEKNYVTKDTVVSYKQWLKRKYAITSANSMLAALNYFFRVVGWQDCSVRAFKVQREAFRSSKQNLSREEYVRLLDAARRQGKSWLYYIMLTVCSTGIRISELQFITLESLNTRRARVSLKGKTRTVILPVELCRELKRYAKEKSISSGSVFVTRSGKLIDRSNILHAMKRLCTDAEVEQSKVFPHNLRHLFAVTYYQKEKDISHLADILGHSNINTTRIYTLVSCEDQEQVLSELGLVI